MSSADLILEHQQLGSFSFISFLKKVLIPIDQREYLSMFKFPRGEDKLMADWGRVEQESADIFAQMQDAERKSMILRQATDLHETHHFHMLLLVPAGEVLIHLMLFRLRHASDVFDKLRDLMQAGREPFEKPIAFQPDSHADGVLNYLLNGTFPGFAATVAMTEGQYPAARMIRFNTGPKGAFAPAVHLEGRTYPIGIRSLFEGATEALIRALVFRCRPTEYFEWYQSTREGESLWTYQLTERVLKDIFGAAYTSLDPVEKHALVAHISISACQPLKPDAPDFFEYRDNHPGWNFLQICEQLWATRTAVTKDGRLDINQVIRMGHRFTCFLPKGTSSLVDHLVGLRVALHATFPAKSDLPLVFWRHYHEYRDKVLTMYLEHRDIFYHAGEWLTCSQRDLLPHVPIMVASSPNYSRPKLNFPDERNMGFWFIWFMFTQLLESIVNGSPACPLLGYDVEPPCPRDQACSELRLLEKDNRCHLRQLLLTSRTVKDVAEVDPDAKA